MIFVKGYTCIETGDIVFKVSGHAGYAPFGEDPICAAASAYAQQAVLIAQALYKEGKLRKRPRISIESGRAVVVMRPKCFCLSPEDMTLNDEFEYAEIVAEVRTVVSGFDWLTKKYPKFIKLEDDVHNC